MASITANIQAAGIQIKSEKDPDESIPADEQTRVQTIIDKHPSAFSGLGLLKDEEGRPTSGKPLSTCDIGLPRKTKCPPTKPQRRKQRR